jgi:hypothetical protein
MKMIVWAIYNNAILEKAVGKIEESEIQTFKQSVVSKNPDKKIEFVQVRYV